MTNDMVPLERPVPPGPTMHVEPALATVGAVAVVFVLVAGVGWTTATWLTDVLAERYGWSVAAAVRVRRVGRVAMVTVAGWLALVFVGLGASVAPLLFGGGFALGFLARTGLPRRSVSEHTVLTFVVAVALLLLLVVASGASHPLVRDVVALAGGLLFGGALRPLFATNWGEQTPPNAG